MGHLPPAVVVDVFYRSRQSTAVLHCSLLGSRI
jgi:hypothetical protein